MMKRKLCPIWAASPRNGRNLDCMREDCSWWCKWGEDCSIPLLAGMFADSEICRTIFDNEGENDE